MYTTCTKPDIQHTQVEKDKVWLHWWAGERHPKGLCNSSTALRFQRSCTFAELIMAVKDDWLECWKKGEWTGLSLMGGSELQYPGTEGQKASAKSHISCSCLQAPSLKVALLWVVSAEHWWNPQQSYKTSLRAGIAHLLQSQSTHCSPLSVLTIKAQ